MKIAYFDCFSGISGDMVLGALLDLGFPESALREGLARLPVGGYEIRVSRQRRGGLEGTRVEVRVDESGQPCRDYQEIRGIIEASGLAATAREKALAVFECLARAEAFVHRIPVEDVHFHEVGAVDSIVDIVGAAVALEGLGIQRCYVSSLPLGGGLIRCSHGILPVPAPATAEILKGMRVKDHPAEAELVTPTGAAIAACLAGPGHPTMPPLRLEKVGYGVGSREQECPNLLRVLLGEIPAACEQDEVQVFECQLDDLQPEIYPHLMEKLLQKGVLDVYLIPVHMKKGRPGVLVQVIADSSFDPLEIARVLFAETTTLGVRCSRTDRLKLSRRPGEIETRFGPVTVKIVEGPGLRGPEIRPEFEVCRGLAAREGLPLRAVYEEIMRAADSSGSAIPPIKK